MKRLPIGCALLGLALCATRCSSTPDPDGDGDVDSDVDGDGDGDGDIDVEPPEPPAALELPILTPCPEGWREVLSEDPASATSCDPYPEGGAVDCAFDDEAHFPGELDCSRIGTACSDGDWADDIPTDVQVLYVLAGTPDGGDGSRAAPLASIGAAMEVASEGSIIALSRGTFDEEVELRSGVTLWGACVAETHVTCSDPDDYAGTITVRGSDTSIRNLRIGGERAGVWIVGSAYSVELEDVLFEGCRGQAWRTMVRAQATGRSIVVRNTRAKASDETEGRGVEALEGAQVDLTRAVIDGNRDTAVSVHHEDTRLSLTDAAVVNTLSQQSDQRYGRGLTVQDGASVEVARSIFMGNREAALFVAGESATLDIVDVVCGLDRRLTRGSRLGHRAVLKADSVRILQTYHAPTP